MQNSIYLRPIGMFQKQDGGTAPGQGGEWPGVQLAGGPLSFSAVEVIERLAGDEIARRIVGLGEAFEREWGRHTLHISDIMEALRAPRSPVLGLRLDRPRIMGIVNVTPDSFSDGGKWFDPANAIEHALELAEQGADILDIGGESTRPGSDTVAVDDELTRVIPVLKGLRDKTDKLISIDTRKSKVMAAAAEAGADIINDVSALTFDPEAMDVAADCGLPVMLMHAQGDPKTMNDDPQYTDVVLDVYDFLAERIAACEDAGIPKAKLIADPGIGFGKHLHHNIAVMGALSLYHGLGVPLLLGASRKKLIGQLCNVDDAEARVPGSLAAALMGVAQGVQIVRVHDVAETRQALSIWQAASAGSEAAALQQKNGQAIAPDRLF